MPFFAVSLILWATHAENIAQMHSGLDHLISYLFFHTASNRRPEWHHLRDISPLLHYKLIVEQGCQPSPNVQPARFNNRRSEGEMYSQHHLHPKRTYVAQIKSSCLKVLAVSRSAA
jgi:hypothetical protein